MRILLPLLLALALAAPTLADEVVIYRCTGEDGGLTLQDFPCASGQVQAERRYERPVDPPPRDDPPPVATPAPVEPDEGGDAVEARGGADPLVVVPALFECRTFDAQTYFSERGDGNRRCVPLSISRIGSGPLPGAASACEWVVDECTRLEPEAACAGWQRLHREAVRAEREAFSDTLAQVREDLDRISAIRDSACAR